MKNYNPQPTTYNPDCSERPWRSNEGPAPFVAGRQGRPWRSNGGIATVELLIAFAIIVLALTGIIVVVFGNQSIALDAELNNLALYKAEDRLEGSFAAAATHAGYQSLGDVAETDGIFNLETAVDSYDCFKVVYSDSSWWETKPRPQGIGLATIFVSLEELEAHAKDCLTEPLEDGFDNPGSLVSDNINGQSAATDVDVEEEFLYLTSSPAAAAKDDFFIYEFDLAGPSLTPRGSLDIGDGGAYGVAVAGDYAYLATASTTAQLQVIDVSDRDNPVRVAVIALDNVDPLGSYPEGRTIFYYDSRVYVGTRETAGREFHVFDVSGDPASPVELGGGLELNHTVRDITVRDGYAFLATSANFCELIVIDVSDPNVMANPCPAGGGTANVYNAPDNNDGSSVHVSGEKVYLGREQTTAAAAEDFFILNVDMVHDGAADDDGLYGPYDLGIQTTAYTTGIEVAGGIAFVGLDDSNAGLQILDISDPGDIKPYSACSSFNFSENSVGLDLEDYEVLDPVTGELETELYVFSANRSNAEIRVIYDQPAACTP